MNAKGISNNTKHSTLCWDCEKACGRCSWSKSFTPVEGWVAKPTKVKGDSQCRNQLIDSFDVHECPEFEPLKLKDEREFLQLLKRNIGKIRRDQIE